jgi:hypothetical protein
MKRAGMLLAVLGGVAALLLHQQMQWTGGHMEITTGFAMHLVPEGAAPTRESDFTIRLDPVGELLNTNGHRVSLAVLRAALSDNQFPPPDPCVIHLVVEHEVATTISDLSQALATLRQAANPAHKTIVYVYLKTLTNTP